MIVTDDQVSASLEYLALDIHPIAEARFKLTKAENKRKQVYAVAFVSTQGKSIADRQAIVECSKEYQEALDAEASAMVEVERHRSRIKSAEMVLEIWRSLQANARTADRVR